MPKLVAKNIMGIIKNHVFLFLKELQVHYKINGFYKVQQAACANGEGISKTYENLIPKHNKSMSKINRKS